MGVCKNNGMHGNYQIAGLATPAPQEEPKGQQGNRVGTKKTSAMSATDNGRPRQQGGLSFCGNYTADDPALSSSTTGQGLQR